MTLSEWSTQQRLPCPAAWLSCIRSTSPAPASTRPPVFPAARPPLLPPATVESIDPAQANPTPASGPTPKKTLAERLELAYNGEEGSELAALRKRQNARQQRMDEESGRSNLPLFAGLLLLFVLPALFILVAASQSGYLDHLANGWGARSSY